MSLKNVKSWWENHLKSNKLKSKKENERKSKQSKTWPYSKIVDKNEDPSGWDISVLCCAILDCGQLQLTEEQRESVRVLRVHRNNIAHKKGSKMDDASYTALEADLMKHYDQLLGERRPHDPKDPRETLMKIRERKNNNAWFCRCLVSHCIVQHNHVRGFRLE